MGSVRVALLVTGYVPTLSSGVPRVLIRRQNTMNMRNAMVLLLKYSQELLKVYYNGVKYITFQLSEIVYLWDIIKLCLDNTEF